MFPSSKVALRLQLTTTEEDNRKSLSSESLSVRCQIVWILIGCLVLADDVGSDWLLESRTAAKTIVSTKTNTETKRPPRDEDAGKFWSASGSERTN